MKQKKSKGLITSELFRISRLSMEASELVLPVIRDKNLKYQVEQQQEAYRATAARAAEILRKSGIKPAEQSLFLGRVMRGSIKADTSWNKSTPHIAQIAIHCTDAAMQDLTRTMNRSADDGTESRKLAEEFLKTGQRDVDLLKQYL
ncbi:MAG: hypothetical protein LKJ17_01475 [Oscillospiraceae bacterium]|jgi:hypothetical protein|nr:hypothetical protein [Oscillospiraceae bacterium]